MAWIKGLLSHRSNHVALIALMNCTLYLTTGLRQPARSKQKITPDYNLSPNPFVTSLVLLFGSDYN
eukprot:972469-Amphidinium_carterae.1